jgi:ribonuclease VapC
MIVFDTSALVVILLGEPGRSQLLAAIRAADRAIMSAVSLLDAGMVLKSRHGQSGVDTLTNLIEDAGLEVAPFDHAQATIAIEAFGRYGKGINATAKLNFSDCALYANYQF